MLFRGLRPMAKVIFCEKPGYAITGTEVHR
jgi:hypothetical protein